MTGTGLSLGNHTSFFFDRNLKTSPSSALSSIKSASRYMSFDRAAGGIRRQEGFSKACRAAATAASTSASPPEATVVKISPVAGSMSTNVSPERGLNVLAIDDESLVLGQKRSIGLAYGVLHRWHTISFAGLRRICGSNPVCSRFSQHAEEAEKVRDPSRDAPVRTSPADVTFQRRAPEAHHELEARRAPNPSHTSRRTIHERSGVPASQRPSRAHHFEKSLL